MLSVSYAGKNVCIAGKSSGVLRGGTSGANRCYVMAHCAPPRFCRSISIPDTRAYADSKKKSENNFFWEEKKVIL